MSGRRLGRLLGSLLVLAIIFGGAFADPSPGFGDQQLSDVIWGAGTFR